MRANCRSELARCRPRLTSSPPKQTAVLHCFVLLIILVLYIYYVVTPPNAKIVPRKIGVQGPSIKKKGKFGLFKILTTSCLIYYLLTFIVIVSSSSPSFTRDEMVELRRLSTMLPPAARGRDAADLVMHAASYIQQLVATVHARVNNGTLPLG
uniref:BHLH domain-containing protein n=1 Tax=Heterorhabditis bacteriophora TaxID=37862 RepID=A0A1I7WNJ9_HETBA